MRTALVVLIAALGLAAGRAPAVAQPRPTATGFDHIVHEGRISVLGRPAIACTACHPMTGAGALLGRPGHAACLGACHPAAPRPGTAPAPDQLQVCSACHAAADLSSRRPPVAYPPYRVEPDYGLTLSHAGHAAAPCVGCHPRPGAGAAPARPHARCASCHGAAAPAAPMTACATCHVAAYGANALPRLVRGPLAVGAAYDHARHAPRTPRAAVACATCHRAVVTATSLDLTPPRTADCATAGCHDGAAAFATTTACTRCHTRAPAAAFKVERPAARFSHDAHAGRLAIDACASCHRLDGRGQPRPAGHEACAGCHGGDFVATAPTICGACHTSTEPWRALLADQRPPPTSDFGARLDHAAHRTVDCARCHALTTAARELRPPRGHTACAGAGCHAATGGPAPALTACDACHERGRERRRLAERTAAPWSVRARFRHAVHGEARDGAALPCASCHGDVTAGDTPAAPRKATCRPCHDGQAAFKMTGHDCARCHGP